MSTKSKWYAQGHADAASGLFDPPWQPGHRDYVRYCEGHTDAEREAQADAEAEVYAPSATQAYREWHESE